MFGLSWLTPSLLKWGGIALLILGLCGFIGFQKLTISSLENSVTEKQNEIVRLGGEITKLKEAVNKSQDSIENCNSGKNALQDLIKKMAAQHKISLENCNRLNEIFKDAKNVPAGSAGGEALREKSDQIIDEYNNILAPFIKP